MLKTTLLIFSLIFFQLCAEERLELTADQKVFLQKHPNIVLGTGKDWGPYIIEKGDGTITGHDHDILTLINKYTGANFVLKPGDWAEMQKLAQSGTIDGLACLVKTTEREKEFVFSDSYTHLHKAIYTTQNSLLKVKSKEDLAGKMIVIEKENISNKKLVESLQMKILYAPSPKVCFQMLMAGKAEAIISNGSTQYLLEKFGFPHLKKVYDLYPDLQLRFAVRKELSEAIEILNKGLAHIPEETYNALKRKWLSNCKVALDSEELHYLHEKKEIKICVDPNWMPFERINKKSKYEGILADYVTLFSKKLHIPFVLQKTENYQQSLSYLKAGRCDLIVGEVATDKMKETFLTTQPYLDISRAFVTHIDANIVHDLSQIVYSGDIGVLSNSPASAFLSEKYQYLKIVSCDTTDEGLQKVASRELTAFVSTLPSLVYSLQKLGLSDVKISGTLSEPVRLSMMLNKKHDALLPILNKVINTITEEERQKILVKWVQIKYIQRFDYTIFYRLLALLLLLLLFFGSRYYNTFQIKKKLEKMHHELKIQMREEIEKNRQQQLMMLQQNRLAQKGEILNMVAHQWRQPLNALSLVNQKLILSYKKGRMHDKEIVFFEQKSHQLIGQMTETINDFTNFFRSEKEKVEFEICQTIEHAISILDPILTIHHIHIAFESEEKILCYGFPNEFGQVLISIINNGKDAIVEREIANPKIIIKSWKEEEKVHVSICDNAGGVSSDILAKIFDPYFSTKDEKNGTGLGLYMCKLIIEGHFGGRLDVENSFDGACFTLWI